MRSEIIPKKYLEDQKKWIPYYFLFPPVHYILIQFIIFLCLGFAFK